MKSLLIHNKKNEYLLPSEQINQIKTELGILD